jgi:Holliday junction resolvase RusA-like endonuclease
MATEAIAFVILGEPASKANSRKIVTIGGRPKSIKSEKARDYEADAIRQIPPKFRVQLRGPVSVTLRIFYASERPDLDESVVLDVLQDRYKTIGKGLAKRRHLVQKGVYVNDRQVREKHVFHSIDRANPRTEVLVEPKEAQQDGFDFSTERHEDAFA